MNFLLRMDIDISESLCGMSRVVKTLDGRNLVLTSSPGEIIKQADCKMIKGEGMPTYRVTGGMISFLMLLIFPNYRILSIKEN